MEGAFCTARRSAIGRVSRSGEDGVLNRKGASALPSHDVQGTTI